MRVVDPIRIFISSVQSEFAQEREALRNYLHDDPLLKRFFHAFLFEDVPAIGGRIGFIWTRWNEVTSI